MDLHEYTADELINNSNRKGRTFSPAGLFFKNFNRKTNTLFLKVGKYICQIALPDLKLLKKEEGSPEAKIELAVSGDVKVFCSCADYAYRFAYVDTQLDFGIYKETRPANITNPNGTGTICKHLVVALENLQTFIPEMAKTMESKSIEDLILEHRILHEKDGVTYKRDCVLVLTPCALWETVVDVIPEEDLYKEGEKYGKENEPHITALYGLLPGEYTDEQIEEILDPYVNIKYTVTGIGVFETEGKPYDVVKFDIVSNDLTQLNSKLKTLPYENEFPDYHPHMTIAYVKKGLGSKYKKTFSEPYSDWSTKVKVSKSDGEKKIIDLTDNLIKQEITTSAMISTPPGDYSYYQNDKENDDDKFGMTVIRPTLP